MSKVNVVMPIAGLGSRFTKIGIDTPKPIIDILGKPMAKWAADSIPFAKPEDFIFIVRREHVEKYNLDKEIKKIFSEKCKVIVIDYVTEGAACTVLLAKEFIDNDNPLIVTDCDHFFISSSYFKYIYLPPKDLKGIIPVFHTQETKWSFSKFGNDKIITQVAEKVPISEYGNIGAYYFAHGKDFVWAAENMINNNERVNNEFYVAPIYNQLIRRGDKIYAAICEYKHGLGTPEDVDAFKKENHLK
jgi:dTDP-glucose pyrophosphorylase